jgi:transposase InsO family protein
LRKAPGGYTHLLVAIDKFSKWVEVYPITNLRAEQAMTFFTDIIYRFGVPNSIITDNGSQFTDRKFLEFCDKFHIRVDWAAVAHPQTNGQVERANGMILQGLKPRIFDRLNKSGRKWLQELPAVVWSLRTTPSRATGIYPIFPCLWHGGRSPHGLGIWVAKSSGLRRGRQPASLRGLAGPTG